MPIPVQKGERGQKIDREEKEKEDRRVVEGTCSLTSSHPLPLFPLRSPLLSTRLEQASWTLTSLFVSAHKKTQKEGQYPAILTEQAWSIIKDFITEKENFSLRNQRGKTKAGKKAHLACSGSQSEHRIRFILTLMSY